MQTAYGTACFKKLTGMSKLASSSRSTNSTPYTLPYLIHDKRCPRVQGCGTPLHSNRPYHAAPILFPLLLDGAPAPTSPGPIWEIRPFASIFHHDNATPKATSTAYQPATYELSAA